MFALPVGADDVLALWVSLRLALVVTPLLMIVAVPLAWLLARHSFPGRAVVEGVCMLPLILPPTVMGFGLLVLMGPQGVVGQAWQALGGGRLVFSFGGLVLAAVLCNVPFALQPVKTAFEALDDRLLESGAMLGLSPWRVFATIALPAASGGIAAGGVLVFAHTLGEFGVALMLGGAIPGETRVASIAIYEQVEKLQYGHAALLAAALLPVSFAGLYALGRLRPARR